MDSGMYGALPPRISLRATLLYELDHVMKIRIKDKGTRYKDFWHEYWQLSREDRKRNDYKPLFFFLLLWVTMGTDYGGLAFLLVLTYSIFANVRNEMEYRRTGEFPYSWKATRVFYGEKIGLVLVRIVNILIIALWIYVLILVLTGTFNEVFS